MPLFVSLLLTATDIKPSHETYQRLLMYNIVATDDGDQWRYFESRLIQPNEDPNDICKWRGVGCQKNIVTHFITSGDIISQSLRVRMFPSAIQFLHLYSVHLYNSWTSRNLPRELKYMFLLTESIKHQPELENLPKQMEELHIMQEMSGIIDLTRLPPKIKILQICGKLDCVPILRNSALPESIKRIRLVHRGDGNGLKKYKSLDGGSIDPCIERKQLIFYGGDSRWYPLFHASVKEMAREWQEEIAGLR